MTSMNEAAGPHSPQTRSPPAGAGEGADEDGAVVGGAGEGEGGLEGGGEVGVLADEVDGGAQDFGGVAAGVQGGGLGG